MPNNRKDNRATFFGLKCVLLALAILMIAGAVILGSFYPILEENNTCLVINLIAIVIVSVVMVLEVKPYLETKNVGIRNIYREKDIEIEKFGKFDRMLEKNTFCYNFQPIVDAKTGDIFAYEALMRSPKEVGLNPRDILKYAEISQRLYSIEYFTFYNTLRIYHENPEKFAGRKMFINSIPSVFLSEADLAEMTEKFGDITENTVVEILEDDEDTKESCVYFEKLRDRFGCGIAIDDYGSGYSNEMKLLNNNPNVIKIDISLISSIDSDMKKQLLVSNIIQFASKYGIKVLAEGVETKEELETLIELGIDLLQGFYLARPNAEILPEIDADARDFIVGESIRRSKFNNDKKIYYTEDGETVSLLELAVQKYGNIHVKSGTVTIVGEPKHPIEMTISTDAKSDCTIELRNANLSGLRGICIEIGQRGTLTLKCTGENTLNREGIRVPANASLFLCGDGSLTIDGTRNDGVGIGGSFSDEFGAITVDMNGSLNIGCSGDRVVCIGGGKQEEGTAIRLLRGTISIDGRGIQTVGVGCGSGSLCLTSTAVLKVAVSGNHVTGIGSDSGSADIEIGGGMVHVSAQGDQLAGIGAFQGKNSKIACLGGRIESSTRGKEAVCIGSFAGTAEIIVSGSEYVNAYAEGMDVLGIGSAEATDTAEKSSLTITGGTVRSYLLAGKRRWFGTDGKNIVITSGNIVSNEENFVIEAVNSFGERLVSTVVEGDSYERRISTEKSNYLYRAVRIPDVDELRVYIPESCAAEAEIRV